jgi:hypothetical protein
MPAFEPHANNNMPEGDRFSQFDLGMACIHPGTPVIAGSYTTISYTYICGHPIDDSGYLKITFRSASDVAAPQFEDPSSANYCSVATTGKCRIEPRWDPKGHIRPWSRALFLMVRGGYLDRGEQITVTFGDTASGSPGWQMQTSCVERFEFKELPESPFLRVVAGEPVRAVCIAPSQAKIEQPFPYYLKLEDRWGNPTGEPQLLIHPGFSQAGVYTVKAQDVATGMDANSNPLAVLPQDAELKRFWADFHGQSGETVGQGTIEAYFRFARDYGLLDIAAHSGNDFQVTDEFWQQINQASRSFYQPGAFTTFPGYEWSGNTPLGGDRNVYFEAEGGQITRSSTELLPGHHSIYPDSSTVTELFQNLSEQPGPRAFTFAHVGGRYANLSMHDPDIELAVEVHSAWGTFEWILEEAFERGYRVGICANSDGHKCRPGASYPGAGLFGSLGGLTCVLAPTLERESIIDALRARHFYATTGNRPLIDLELTVDGRPYGMGDVAEVGVGRPQLHVGLVGTAPIDYVEVRNGVKVIQRLRPYGIEDLGRRVKIVWRGAQVRGRDRMVHWDGSLAIEGNAVMEAMPLNFWNANAPLRQTDPQHLAWKSATTGGTAGVILTLVQQDSGIIKIATAQGAIEAEVAALGLEPSVWHFGGLDKQVSISRLPDRQATHAYAFDLPLTALHPGDNPIYIHIVQEDEQRAWTSPVYLVS